jgi:hypothetical protein
VSLELFRETDTRTRLPTYYTCMRDANTVCMFALSQIAGEHQHVRLMSTYASAACNFSYVYYTSMHIKQIQCVSYCFTSQISGVRLHMSIMWAYPVIIHSSRCPCHSDIPRSVADFNSAPLTSFSVTSWMHTTRVCAMRIQCVCLLVSDRRQTPARAAHVNICECSLQFLTYILHE